jgi:hypothetical protein
MYVIILIRYSIFKSQICYFSVNKSSVRNRKIQYMISGPETSSFKLYVWSKQQLGICQRFSGLYLYKSGHFFICVPRPVY